MWIVKTFRHSPFLQNAALLTATSLLLRTAGIFFRVYLSNRIGAEGMGLYQLIISVYVLGSAFAAAGLCTAVTRLVTDALCRGNRTTALRALRGAVLVSIVVGIASAALLIVTADPVSRLLLQDVRAVGALRTLTLSLPFMGISSCLKGYFMARRKVSLTARAQLLEQAVRIAVIWLLLSRLSPSDLGAACVIIMAGDVVAEIASCLCLIAGFRRDRRTLPSGGRRDSGVMATLMGIALPISAGRYLNTALHTVENLLVPNRLTVYTASRAVALAQFGSLKGMALPLLFFPSSFLSAIATLLIPEISESTALGRQERVQEAVARTLHITLTASVLIGGVFFLYAPQLGQLLYHSDEVGMMLRVLSPLVPAMYLESMIDGILKGLNQQVSSLRYSVIDSVLRMALIIWLVPRTGIRGFLFVMTVSNLLVAFLNLNRLLTVTQMRFRWRQWIVAPLLAVGLSCVGSHWFQHIAPVSLLPQLAAVTAGVILLCALYALLLLAFGCVSRQDLSPVHTVR